MNNNENNAQSLRGLYPITQEEIDRDYAQSMKHRPSLSSNLQQAEREAFQSTHEIRNPRNEYEKVRGELGVNRASSDRYAKVEKRISYAEQEEALNFEFRENIFGETLKLMQADPAFMNDFNNEVEQINSDTSFYNQHNQYVHPTQAANAPSFVSTNLQPYAPQTQPHPQQVVQQAPIQQAPIQQAPIQQQMPIQQQAPVVQTPITMQTQQSPAAQMPLPQQQVMQQSPMVEQAPLEVQIEESSMPIIENQETAWEKVESFVQEYNNQSPIKEQVDASMAVNSNLSNKFYISPSELARQGNAQKSIQEQMKKEDEIKSEESKRHFIREDSLGYEVNFKTKDVPSLNTQTLEELLVELQDEIQVAVNQAPAAPVTQNKIGAPSAAQPQAETTPPIKKPSIQFGTQTTNKPF
ncbi:MAG: hypothetical protein ACRC4M_00265 [Mycoplasma sp.]